MPPATCGTTGNGGVPVSAPNGQFMPADGAWDALGRPGTTQESGWRRLDGVAKSIR